MVRVSGIVDAGAGGTTFSAEGGWGAAKGRGQGSLIGALRRPQKSAETLSTADIKS